MRSVWKGNLCLGLVSVPVKAYSAIAAPDGKVTLHQIHRSCHSRIKYQKVCPLHGEIEAAEIASGYEIAQDQYAVLEAAELDALYPENDRALRIDGFLRPDQLDTCAFAGRHYFLVPDGPLAAKPYAAIAYAMIARDTPAIARVVLYGNKQVVVVQADDAMLWMSVLNWQSQFVNLNQIIDKMPCGVPSKEELRLADTLLEAMTPQHLELSRYQDEYPAKLLRLIEAKARGQNIVAPPGAAANAPTTDLTGALEASLAELRPAAKRKPPKRQTRRRKLA